MSKPRTLIKFGRYEHLLQLQEEGLLYMNNLEYIRRIEDGAIRGDPFDNVDRLARGTRVMIRLKDLEPAINITGHYTLGMSNSDPKRINLFCMYALRPSAGSFPIDKQCLSLGDYGLVFTKVTV